MNIGAYATRTVATQAAWNIEDERAALQAARTESWGQINRYRLRAVLEYAGPLVLDVGCSAGGYVEHLAARGYRVCGLDLLADARWRQGTEQRYTVGNACALPFCNKAFDTILAFEVLEHVADPDLALAEFCRVCAGNVILTVPDCETPDGILRAGLVYAHWRDRTHRSFFTERSLRDTLSRAGLWLVSMGRINAVLVDYPVLRSLHVPRGLAYLAARAMRRLPGRTQYGMTLLAIAAQRHSASAPDHSEAGYLSSAPCAGG